MTKRLPEILIKAALIGVELLFVGLLCALRLQIIGWGLIILGLGILLWVLVHLGLMTAFIIGLKIRLPDILLYLAVHTFYLTAWLFQSDGGDGGDYMWAIQQINAWPSLTPFLNKYGDTVFWWAFAATLLSYLLIVILLIVKLVKYARTLEKPLPAAPTPRPSR